MKLLLTLLLLVVSVPTYACRPNLNHILWSMENASDVYVGRVTGSRNISFEHSLREKDDSEIITIPERIKMRVFITQTLEGDTDTIVEADSTLCRGGYNVREKVFVFKNTESNNIFAISEEDLKGNFDDLYKMHSNKSVNFESAKKTPLKLH